MGVGTGGLFGGCGGGICGGGAFGLKAGATLGAGDVTGADLGATFAGGWAAVGGLVEVGGLAAGGLLVVGGDVAATGGCVTAGGVPEDGEVAVGFVGGNFDGVVAGAWALIDASGQQRHAKANAQNIAAIVDWDLLETRESYLLIYGL